MGEVEKTMERLNRAMVEAGFPRMGQVHLSWQADGGWDFHAGIFLRFDKDGSYIEPEGGEYA
jgi:hypothetical protein